MKRKIIKLGTATLVASLPSKWVRQFNLKSGDYLEVDDSGPALVLSAEKERISKRIEVDLTDLTGKNIFEYILALYKKGYDEIKLNFRNPEVEDLTGKKTKTISLIQEYTDQLMGIEIIDQKENYVVIKDFSKGIEMDYDQVIKRVFSIINEMGIDSLKNIKSFDKAALESIRYRHNSVNKFISYCIRLLNKNPHSADLATKSKIAEDLEEISDVYSWIPKEVAGSKIKLTEHSIKVYSKVNECFSATFDLYCVFNKENIIKVDELRKESFSMINAAMKNAPKQDTILYCRLSVILNEILNLYQFLVTISLK